MDEVKVVQKWKFIMAEAYIEKEASLKQPNFILQGSRKRTAN